MSADYSNIVSSMQSLHDKIVSAPKAMTKAFLEDVEADTAKIQKMFEAVTSESDKNHGMEGLNRLSNSIKIAKRFHDLETTALKHTATTTFKGAIESMKSMAVASSKTAASSTPASKSIIEQHPAFERYKDLNLTHSSAQQMLFYTKEEMDALSKRMGRTPVQQSAQTIKEARSIRFEGVSIAPSPLLMPYSDASGAFIIYKVRDPKAKSETMHLMMIGENGEPVSFALIPTKTGLEVYGKWHKNSYSSLEAFLKDRANLAKSELNFKELTQMNTFHSMISFEEANKIIQEKPAGSYMIIPYPQHSGKAIICLRFEKAISTVAISANANGFIAELISPTAASTMEELIKEIYPGVKQSPITQEQLAIEQSKQELASKAQGTYTVKDLDKNRKLICIKLKDKDDFAMFRIRQTAKGEYETEDLHFDRADPTAVPARIHGNNLDHLIVNLKNNYPDLFNPAKK